MWLGTLVPTPAPGALSCHPPLHPSWARHFRSGTSSCFPTPPLLSAGHRTSPRSPRAPPQDPQCLSAGTEGREEGVTCHPVTVHPGDTERPVRSKSREEVPGCGGAGGKGTFKAALRLWRRNRSVLSLKAHSANRLNKAWFRVPSVDEARGALSSELASCRIPKQHN